MAPTESMAPTQSPTEKKHCLNLVWQQHEYGYGCDMFHPSDSVAMSVNCVYDRNEDGILASEVCPVCGRCIELTMDPTKNPTKAPTSEPTSIGTTTTPSAVPTVLPCPIDSKGVVFRLKRGKNKNKGCNWINSGKSLKVRKNRCEKKYKGKKVKV